MKLPKFKLGDRVRKLKGSEWTGVIVGEYSTDMTPEGYCVESEHHVGSVQIYPAAALALYHDKEDVAEKNEICGRKGSTGYSCALPVGHIGDHRTEAFVNAYNASTSTIWVRCSYVFPDGIQCIHGHNHLGIHVKPVGL